MNVPEGVAKMFAKMDNDAPSGSSGPDRRPDTCTTSSPVPTADRMSSTISNSSAGHATAPSTERRSGLRLSEEEGMRWFRIKKDIRLGFMLSMEDVNFLAGLVRRATGEP